MKPGVLDKKSNQSRLLLLNRSYQLQHQLITSCYGLCPLALAQAGAGAGAEAQTEGQAVAEAQHDRVIVESYVES